MESLAGSEPTGVQERRAETERQKGRKRMNEWFSSSKPQAAGKTGVRSDSTVIFSRPSLSWVSVRCQWENFDNTVIPFTSRIRVVGPLRGISSYYLFPPFYGFGSLLLKFPLFGYGLSGIEAPPPCILPYFKNHFDILIYVLRHFLDFIVSISDLVFHSGSRPFY